jgi:hypothetical protein
VKAAIKVGQWLLTQIQNAFSQLLLNVYWLPGTEVASGGGGEDNRGSEEIESEHDINF